MGKRKKKYMGFIKKKKKKNYNRPSNYYRYVSCFFPYRQVFIDYIAIMFSSSNKESWRHQKMNRLSFLMVNLLIKNIL